MSTIGPKLLKGAIEEAHRAILSNECSVTGLCQSSLKVIEDTRHLNSFITLCQNEAISRAAELDQSLSLSKTKADGRLFGIPISIKDNFCTESILTTCGSRMLHNFIPPYTATSVKKLLDANSIMIGKTNMDEFAMGSSSLTSYYGPSAYQFNSEPLKGLRPNKYCDNSEWYLAGGSSSGSAVSVSVGACFASLGTDTGGSTRQPASWTGVVGFKPTYGLISRFGLVPLAHCMDVVSILARSVQDVELVFGTIVGQDENDLTTVDHRHKLRNPIKSRSGQSESFDVQIGIPREFINKSDISDEVSKRFEDLVKSLSRNVHFKKVAFKVKNIDLPHSNSATECYTIISSAEIASNMSCYDGVKYGFATPIDESMPFDRDRFYMKNRDLGFGSEVKKRILLGNYFLLSGNKEKYLFQAQRLRNIIRAEFDEVFNKDSIDIILMPSTPTTSNSYGDWLEKQEKNRLFYEDYFLIPANIANVPSISLPCGYSTKKLPIGVQLVANRYHDLDLLAVSKLLQEYIPTMFDE